MIIAAWILLAVMVVGDAVSFVLLKTNAKAHAFVWKIMAPTGVPHPWDYFEHFAAALILTVGLSFLYRFIGAKRDYAMFIAAMFVLVLGIQKEMLDASFDMIDFASDVAGIGLGVLMVYVFLR